MYCPLKCYWGKYCPFCCSCTVAGVYAVLYSVAGVNAVPFAAHTLFWVYARSFTVLLGHILPLFLPIYCVGCMCNPLQCSWGKYFPFSCRFTTISVRAVLYTAVRIDAARYNEVGVNVVFPFAVAISGAFSLLLV